MRREREDRTAPSHGAADARRARLAAALRENLQKRKGQVRARLADEAPQQPPEPSHAHPLLPSRDD